MIFLFNLPGDYMNYRIKLTLSDGRRVYVSELREKRLRFFLLSGHELAEQQQYIEQSLSQWAISPSLSVAFYLPTRKGVRVQAFWDLCWGWTVFPEFALSITRVEFEPEDSKMDIFAYVLGLRYKHALDWFRAQY